MTSFCEEGVTGGLGNYVSAVRRGRTERKASGLGEGGTGTSEAAQGGSARRPHISGCRCNGSGLPELQAPQKAREPAQEGRGGRSPPGSDLMLVLGLGADDTLPFKLVWAELSVTCTEEHLRSVLGLSSNACHRRGHGWDRWHGRTGLPCSPRPSTPSFAQTLLSAPHWPPSSTPHPQPTITQQPA